MRHRSVPWLKRRKRLCPTCLTTMAEGIARWAADQGQRTREGLSEAKGRRHSMTVAGRAARWRSRTPCAWIRGQTPMSWTWSISCGQTFLFFFLWSLCAMKSCWLSLFGGSYGWVYLLDAELTIPVLPYSVTALSEQRFGSVISTAYSSLPFNRLIVLILMVTMVLKEVKFILCLLYILWVKCSTFSPGAFVYSVFDGYVKVFSCLFRAYGYEELIVFHLFQQGILWGAVLECQTSSHSTDVLKFLSRELF